MLQLNYTSDPCTKKLSTLGMPSGSQVIAGSLDSMIAYGTLDVAKEFESLFLAEPLGPSKYSATSEIITTTDGTR